MKEFPGIVAYRNVERVGGTERYLKRTVTNVTNSNVKKEFNSLSITGRVVF